MANAHGTSQLSVIDQLEAHPQLFSYEQCVSILEKKYNIRFKSVSYFSDAIITCSKHTLALSAYDISEVDISNDNAKIYAERMSITSLNGPLPNVYTEQISAFKWLKNNSLSDFINIFTNRLSYISYKLTQRMCPGLQSKPSTETNIGRCINALAGMKDDRNFQQYAFMMWNIPRSALGLRLILSNYFGVDVEITQFYGAFTEVTDVTRLGESCSVLGDTAFLGNSYFSHENGLKIALGPLENDTLSNFTPGGKWHTTLHKLIDNYLDKEIDYKIELIPKQHKGCELGNGRLGYETWATSDLQSERPGEKMDISLRRL